MLSGRVRDPPGPIAVFEYQLPASALFPGGYIFLADPRIRSHVLYPQYFESAAARELFEFQVFMSFEDFRCFTYLLVIGRSMKDTESEVSKQYAAALKNVAHHGVGLFHILYHFWR